MKVMLGFLVGVIVSLIFTVGLLSSVLMRSGNSSDGVSSSQEAAEEVQSGNITQSQDSTTGLLPDIGKIYREALVSPFIEAEKEIHDEDIAQYYHGLLQRCGLDKP
jgi:hypothetical protein